VREQGLGEAIDFVGAGLVLLLVALGVAGRATLVIEHPRLVLTVIAAITLGAAAAIVRVEPPGLRIGLDPSSEPLLPTRDPGQEVYRQAVLDFGSDDIYVIAMETDDVFTHENLSTLRRITDRIRQLHGVRGAESLVDTYAFRYDAEQDWVEVGKLMTTIPSTREELEDLRSRTLADPLYPKVMIAPDARTAAVNVTFQPMTDGEFVARDLDGRIRAILDEERGPSRRFFVSGRPHIRSEAHHLMVGDILRLIPLAVAVGALVLWLLTGSTRGTLVPLLSCLTATIWTFGAMALTGRNLNIITLVLGPMLICVGSVYGVHVMGRYELFALDPGDRRWVALRTLQYTKLPVLMAGFTTCVGFAALLLSDVQATNELGASSVFGIAAVTLLSVTGVPAALSLLPLEHAAMARGVALYEGRTFLSAWVGRTVDRGLGTLGHASIRHPTLILCGWAILTAIAVALVPRIVIDTDYLTVFDSDSPVRTDFAEVNRLLAGAVPIYVVFQGAEEGTFREPETLRAVADFQGRLEETPGVSTVLSAVDLIRVANRALREGRPEEERIPDTRAGVAEAIFSIPKEKLRRFATSNHSSTNLVVRTGELGSAAVRRLEGRILAELARTPVPTDVRTGVTGSTILINRSADGIAGNQIAQVGAAATTILILVCIAFRSIRIGLLSMIPNIVPVLLFFGALGAGAATLSIATSLIGSIALGIAIDDTVHFLVTYNRERWGGRTPEEAVQHSIRRVGRPIVMTSMMLVIGFLVLLVSGFVTLREFGYLTAMTMAICLSTDLGLLPALLLRARA
jgi:predicted RND superfamily exporter protein